MNISPASVLAEKIVSGKAVIGIIGLGYVGLPLAIAVTAKGLTVQGLDIDAHKPEILAARKTYLRSVSTEAVAQMMDTGLFSASTDFSLLRGCDVVVLCVPTPLNPYREPDLSYVEKTVETVAEYLQVGQLVVLESTTYPGTTIEVVQPILEKTGLKAHQDFFLAYSPEREDPGNAKFSTTTIPKVVGADHATSLKLACDFYQVFIEKIHPVSSSKTAEAVKLTENIFRSVNVALVNELKIIYRQMGIDIWEVIEAAKTKPFGYMPFYPGPGLGGHCIPIDPFYLTWKAREYGCHTRFIELAGEINTEAPRHVVNLLTTALNDYLGKALKGTKILLVGIAYKKNIDDMRESPALTLMELLKHRGALVEYYDPYVPVIPPTREFRDLTGHASCKWEQAIGGNFDVALIATDHDGVDYQALANIMPLVVDTRNATSNISKRDNIVMA
ncbi:MAG: nucleotide sugar dehydrogenase [Alphaproteobacteria bacterium]